jgi:hypothetical protein
MSNLERVWAGALSFYLWNYAFWLYIVAALSVVDPLLHVAAALSAA